MFPILQRADLLAGGFLLTFSSSLGQTWFIALSGPAVRAELGLGHGAFGGLYSLATLLSGLTLMWLGASIDRLAPHRVAVGVAAGLGLGCLGMATVGHPLALLAVLFCLRLCGQGLMTHVAMTTVGRSFAASRGRALAVTGLGFPAAEALLPAVAVLAIGSFGWRSTWAGAGALALLVLPPLLAVLLRRTPAAEPAEGLASSAPLRRRDILLSARFALLLPTILSTGFVITAVFFHQGALAAAKGWPAGWFAACIPAYAACSVIAMLGVGFLIDRYGARRVLPLFLLPLVAAMALLAMAQAPLVALVAIGLAGLSAGASNTVVTAGLAELYGTTSLGTVRAVAASAAILASALSPALVGLALDADVSVATVLIACLGLSLAAGPLAARAVWAGTPVLAGRGAA